MHNKKVGWITFADSPLAEELGGKDCISSVILSTLLQGKESVLSVNVSVSVRATLGSGTGSWEVPLLSHRFLHNAFLHSPRLRIVSLLGSAP